MKGWSGAVAAAALSIALVACGSGSETEPTSAHSTEPTQSSTAAGAQAPPMHVHQTIADYIKGAGITEARVKRGDPGSPTITLPVPPGWRDAGPDTPPFAYQALVLDDPAVAADPATVIGLVSKLTGPVDAEKIFEYAPGELNNLPGYNGAAQGTRGTLAGFDAVQLGGTYVKDGVQRMIAQKTVLIPAADGSGLYVLQLNANGLEGQMNQLLDAVSRIDADTTITP